MPFTSLKSSVPKIGSAGRESGETQLKIAHVTSQLCRRSAGLGAAVEEHSAATARADNEVRVFGLASPEWREGDHAAWAGAPATAFDTAPWSGPFGYAPAMLASLLSFDPDIVHLHGLWTYPSVAAYRWHRKTGRPLVCSAHGMLLSVALDYSPQKKKVARLLFQDMVLQAAAVLHATSLDEASAYRGLGFHNRLEIIPLGIEATPRPAIERNRPMRRALFLGRLHHKKGIDWLIEAWTSLEKEFPDWELSVVGPLEKSYTGEIERLKADAANGRVSFVGPLYGDEKFRHIAASDLFLMPSRSENFGLTAAESLLMEVPVIAGQGTPWSGLVPAKAGWWVEPGPAALEAAMREAMRLPAGELLRMGQNGRRWIERDFSWPVIAARWQHVYESLMPATLDLQVTPFR